MKEPWRYVRQSFFSIIECIDSLIKLAEQLEVRPEKCNISAIIRPEKCIKTLIIRPEKCNNALLCRGSW